MTQDEREVSPVEDHDIAGREDEVGRHAAAEAVKTGQQPLRIAGAAVRERVSGLGERPRQVDFGAVDGEGPVSVPVRAARVAGEDPAVRVAEHVLVHAGAGLADGGDGDRLRLRQRDAEAAALVPQLGGHGGAAFLSARQRQAEHEQHHDQGVQRPAPLHPCFVAARGDGGGRVGDPGPHRGEAVVKGGGRAAFRPRPGCRLPLEDRAELRVQRPDQNLLGRLGAAPAALSGRHADLLPVGGLVAGAVEAGRIDEGLAEDRAAAVVRLPAFRKPAQGQRQRLRRQIVDADPRQDQKAMEWTPPICGVMMRQNKNARLCASETRKEAMEWTPPICGVTVRQRKRQTSCALKQRGDVHGEG